ncbi:ABC transporter permease [Oleiagrimonas soli]|uniref:Putative ABC transport system permease protein n=1 Tax=Oleiagrimonas soli TaxID=1543381 RepID=A0A841KER3_9GAMM|nr:FtsX-like permease family protein [Oleiagrimonas soli]MBB6184113.1 putative ABC transport system permease protein [Oleiagrimonas soli]
MGGMLMLKTLKRNGFMPLLVVAQVVFALVVLVNTGSLLQQQMAPILAATGVPEGALLLTHQLNSQDAGQDQWSYASLDSAERAVRAIPGVIAVSSGMGTPMSVGGMLVRATPTDARSGRSVDADVFGGDHLVDTLGLHVLRGRDFSDSDYMTGSFIKMYQQTRAALISDTLAQRLFPDGDAVGQEIWMSPKPSKGRDPLRIVGVFSDTLSSQITGPSVHAVLMLPLRMDDFGIVSFMVRVKPAQRDAVMKRLPEVLGTALGMHNPQTMKVERYEDARAARLHGNTVASWLLLTVLGTVSIVVVLGITGLSGFWVQKRTREIGIQRALGARRGDILRQYQFENFLVVCAGAVLGVLLGLIVAEWLRRHFELTSPPLAAWAAGALVLVVFGQLAVLGPARRASRVPPVVATRSV